MAKETGIPISVGCAKISGVLILGLGGVLVMQGLGSLDASLAHLISGGVLGIFGLSMLCHALDICPLCK